MRRRAMAALAVMGLAGALRAGSAPADIDDIRLVVFRQQVAFWLGGHARESSTVVCLSVEERGARRSVTREYLKHFVGEAAVRVQDDCEERASGAVERRTGRPAVLVSVGRVSWQSADEAWVETRHFRSGVISGVRTQRVVRDKAGWTCLGQVIKDGPA